MRSTFNLKNKNKDWKPATVKRYNNIKTLLEDFEKEKSYKLTFNTITTKFYTEFTYFCMNKRGYSTILFQGT